MCVLTLMLIQLDLNFYLSVQIFQIITQDFWVAFVTALYLSVTFDINMCVYVCLYNLCLCICIILFLSAILTDPFYNEIELHLVSFSD